MKIMVLGAGSFGGSLAQVLVDNKKEVILWSHNEEEVQNLKKNGSGYIEKKSIDKIHVTSDINMASKSDIIVFVVPSFALRETAKKIKKIISKDAIIVLCTKGIERDTMKTGEVVLREELGSVNLSILSGPTHAEEIAKRMFTSIVSTSENDETGTVVQHLFNNDYFRVYKNNDIKGVELSGAVKNILAIASGFCDSSPQFGDNAKAFLLTRGLRELRQLVIADGGSINTIYGLTGMGDLIVTATSKHSRNRMFGELLGKGLSVKDAQEKIGMVVEGYYSLVAIHQLKEKYKLDLPIIQLIFDVVYNEANIEDLFNIVKTRSLKSED